MNDDIRMDRAASIGHGRRRTERGLAVSLRSLPPGYLLGADGVARNPDHRPSPGPERPFADHVSRLMACPSFAGRLSPEEEVSLWCASQLRGLTRRGLLRCAWTMVPGENKQGGRLGMMHQARQVALGYVPGCPDFLFLWGSGSGGIELKVDDPQGRLLPTAGGLAPRKGRRTYQRERQVDFQNWCVDRGVRYEVARRWGEMEAVLVGWGLLP
jgi:hypothetical protein